MFGVTFIGSGTESELVPNLLLKHRKPKWKPIWTAQELNVNVSPTARDQGSVVADTPSNRFTGEACPVWISDYVLAGYGTGAIMAVPAHDTVTTLSKRFNLPYGSIW